MQTKKKQCLRKLWDAICRGLEKHWGVWVIGVPSAIVAGYLWFLIRDFSLMEKYIVDGGYSITKAGALGDSFGILTCLFSGMAFFAAFYLLKAQQKEFKKIHNHAEMMSQIERASFQPRFYCEYTERENGTLKIATDPSQEQPFFIFQEAQLEGGLQNDAFNTREGFIIELNEPIKEDCYLYFSYKDLSGYVTVVMFRVTKIFRRYPISDIKMTKHQKKPLKELIEEFKKADT